jgi:hypothetical protein
MEKHLERIVSMLKGHAIEAAAELLYGSVSAMVAEDLEAILEAPDRSAALDAMIEASLLGSEEPDDLAAWTSYAEIVRAEVCQ